MALDHYRDLDFSVGDRHGDLTHRGMRPEHHLIGVGAPGRGEPIDLLSGKIQLDIILLEETPGQESVIGSDRDFPILASLATRNSMLRPVARPTVKAAIRTRLSETPGPKLSRTLRTETFPVPRW